MNIETFRDLVLSVFFILAILIIIGSAIFILILYMKIKKIIDSVGIIVTRLTILTEYASKVGMPLITIVAFVQGVREGLKTFANIFRKSEEEEGK